ncbi:MAG: nitroreductase family protein [Candidatus Xenobia bacterium]
MKLNLSPDELLSTTRAVRKRLDLTRPVEREVLEECLALAQQAPSASNQQKWHFVVVTDAAKKRVVHEAYLKGMAIYKAPVQPGNPLVEGMWDIPALVIPCLEGRLENAPVPMQAAMWGTIVPATWSFMLACRSRGLGTVYTTLHLFDEEKVAKALGIPFESVMQTAMIPVAYTQGTEFKPGPRRPLDTMVHWEQW